MSVIIVGRRSINSNSVVTMASVGGNMATLRYLDTPSVREYCHVTLSYHGVTYTTTQWSITIAYWLYHKLFSYAPGVLKVLKQLEKSECVWNWILNCWVKGCKGIVAEVCQRVFETQFLKERIMSVSSLPIYINDNL